MKRTVTKGGTRKASSAPAKRSINPPAQPTTMRNVGDGYAGPGTIRHPMPKRWR